MHVTGTFWGDLSFAFSPFWQRLTVLLGCLLASMWLVCLGKRWYDQKACIYCLLISCTEHLHLVNPRTNCNCPAKHPQLLFELTSMARPDLPVEIVDQTLTPFNITCLKVLIVHAKQGRKQLWHCVWQFATYSSLLVWSFFWGTSLYQCFGGNFEHNVTATLKNFSPVVIYQSKPISQAFQIPFLQKESILSRSPPRNINCWRRFLLFTNLKNPILGDMWVYLLEQFGSFPVHSPLSCCWVGMLHFLDYWCRPRVGREWTTFWLFWSRAMTSQVANSRFHAGWQLIDINTHCTLCQLLASCIQSLRFLEHRNSHCD